MLKVTERMDTLTESQGSAIPSTLTDLVTREPVGEAPALDLHPTRRGQSRAPERLKVRAFELFCDGQSLGDVARTLNCSRQYLYRIALKEDWVGRRSKLQALSVLDDSKYVEALDNAVGELRSRLSTRLAELNELCEKKNIKAILAWLQMSGLTGKDIPEPPRPVVVVNDLSDQRRVTVVQEQPKVNEGLESPNG